MLTTHTTKIILVKGLEFLKKNFPSKEKILQCRAQENFVENLHKEKDKKIEIIRGYKEKISGKIRRK